MSPKLSPSLSSKGGSGSGGGSILHGTPVSSPSLYSSVPVSNNQPHQPQSRYDPPNATLLRQMTPPHKEAPSGSITQGDLSINCSLIFLL